MIGSWRVVLSYTIAFYIYQRVFKAHKLNDQKKLTGRPSPSKQEVDEVAKVLQEKNQQVVFGKQN